MVPPPPVVARGREKLKFGRSHPGIEGWAGGEGEKVPSKEGEKTMDGEKVEKLLYLL